MDKAELSDKEIIRHGIELVGPQWNRAISAMAREIAERADPALYRKLSADHPLLFGEDSLRRIELEFPELFRDSMLAQTMHKDL